MDRYDPNEWTKEFVLSEKSFCVDQLKSTNEKVLAYVQSGEYAAAIAGLDRMLNGLIVFQNAGAGNCRPFICGLSFAEGDIIACAMEDAPSGKRRENAIKAFMDARDFSNGEMGKLAENAIDLLESGVSFEEFKEEVDPNFPDDCAAYLLSSTIQKWDDLKKPTSAPSKSGGCYVATAVYGSYDCPQVWTLRRYRDHSLAATKRGRLFIKVYYATSPVIVKWFGKTNWFNKFWRTKLDRMVKELNEKGFDSTPYNDEIDSF